MRPDKELRVNHIITLIIRHHNHTITSQEEDELNRWVNEDPGHKQLFEELTDKRHLEVELKKLDEYDEELALRSLMRRLDNASTSSLKYRRLRKVRWVAAAIIVGLIGTFVLKDLVQGSEFDRKPAVTVIKPIKDIAPGGTRAVLTLANGRTVILDSVPSGPLANQGGSRIVKLNSRVLAYQASDATAKGTLQYNTLTTPKGGEFQLELPDGTRVWLNAASSIRFPTSFSDPERRVQLTGEAYFEVAKDVHKPFIVQKGNTEIRVLGTHFDLNAYEDESVMKVTLLEGSVMVSQLSSNHSRIIKSGEQIQLDDEGRMKLVKDVDVNRVVAWKDGRFEFSGNIQDIMRQISRWYDVKVIYRGNVTDKAFEGAISKYEYVSHVLKMLELTGSIHFTVQDNPETGQGQEIIVRP